MENLEVQGRKPTKSWGSPAKVRAGVGEAGAGQDLQTERGELVMDKLMEKGKRARKAAVTFALLTNCKSAVTEEGALRRWRYQRWLSEGKVIGRGQREQLSSEEGSRAT